MAIRQVEAVAIMSLVSLVLLPKPALAYLDPGTGSLILQGIIGVIAGVLVALRLYWQRIKLFFAGKSDANPAKDRDPENG